MDRPYFTFFKSYYEAISILDDNDQLEVYKAISIYSLTEEEPEFTSKVAKAIFAAIRPTLENNIKQYKNGVKPKEAKRKPTGSQMEAKSKPNTSEPLTNKEMEMEKEKEKELYISFSDEKDCSTQIVERIIQKWNSLSDVGVKPVSKLNKQSTRYKSLIARIKQYGEEDIIKTIDRVRSSDFLTGKVKEFVITFDWFVKPNNYIKIAEGNYDNKPREVKKTDFNSFENQRRYDSNDLERMLVANR